ncbi:MAG: LysM peptidoglycan-binding domain-containing protein [Chloroflexi bacterium]|nr:LysM peptidoglycan-binding domain-containing protein [Chloroflexota bacterium]
MNTQKQIFLIVALFFIFTGGCAAYTVIDLPIRAKDQAAWQKSQSVERGALLFANNCRACHGLTGQGGVGLPLNKDAFQNQDPLILANNKALLQRTLACGRAGTRMPVWLNTNGGSLNQRQIDHLVDLITAPVDAKYKDDQGNPTSEGWAFASKFGQNLNRETALAIGGDTLGTIAKDHLVGVAELQAINPGYGPDDVIPKERTIKLPPTKQDPGGRNYIVRKDRETLTKIADGQAVGAVIIAELNNINYKLEAKTAALTLVPAGGDTSLYGNFGLFPGRTLKLPDTAQYVVKSGDTLQTIAAQHGLQPADIAGPNTKVLGGVTDPAQALSSDTKLKLPASPVAVVQEGQTVASIAAAHGVKAEDIQALNGLQATTVVGVGQALKLPADALYAVQQGDTLASVAAAHGTTADALARANGLSPSDPIRQQVILKLPKVDKFSIKGQSLADVAKTLSNVTADSLAATNKVKANDVLQVGQPLTIPADSWGSVPPDTLNPGTACVQHAIPQSVFESGAIPGVGSPPPTATMPPTQSREVSISAGPSDWTVTADGAKQTANQGVVLIAKGTVVKFTGASGLHTIDINGQKQGEDFKQGETREITFNEAGTFKITCQYHPAMLATVFVQ